MYPNFILLRDYQTQLGQTMKMYAKEREHSGLGEGHCHILVVTSASFMCLTAELKDKIDQMWQRQLVALPYLLSHSSIVIVLIGHKDRTTFLSLGIAQDCI